MRKTRILPFLGQILQHWTMRLFMISCMILLGGTVQASTCSSLLSSLKLSVGPYRVVDNMLILEQRGFYGLSSEDLRQISDFGLSVYVGSNGKYTLGFAQGTRLTFSPELEPDVQKAVEALERLSRSSTPMSFSSRGQPLASFGNLSSPHPQEPWYNYRPQFEVGLWLVKLTDGTYEGQFFTSKSRESFDPFHANQAWEALLDRVAPGRILEVAQYHTHPFRVSDIDGRMGFFSVLSSVGDQLVAYDFLQNVPREEELNPRVRFSFFAVSRIHREMVVSETSAGRVVEEMHF